MQSFRDMYWQDGDAWRGHLQEFPDYLTQGGSMTDLEAHRRDLHKDLTSRVFPALRRVAEFAVSSV